MHFLKIPRLGVTMEHGTVRDWLVREGSAFEAGDELYDLETEKSINTIEAKAPGTLYRIVVGGGVELPVGTVIAVVADPGESLGDEHVAAALASESRGSDVTSPPGPSDELASTAPQAQRGDSARVKAVPRARARAEELGLALASITGTGEGGMITVADVESAASRTAESDDERALEVRERRAVTGIARAMASSMSRSWSEIPQFVQQVSIDATPLVAARRRHAEHGDKVTLTDLLVQAVAKAAVAVPEANATFTGDEVILYEDVNVGVAVASDSGLVVPVIHGAQKLDLLDISQRLRDLSERGRARSLRAEDTAAGTITVSNLGKTAVVNGTPLITPPQTAIVFAGGVIDSPFVVDGQVAVRPVLGIAIAYDHRVLDGMTASGFTDQLVQNLQST